MKRGTQVKGEESLSQSRGQGGAFQEQEPLLPPVGRPGAGF